MLCLKNEYFLIFQKHTLLVQIIGILCLQINAYFILFSESVHFFHKISTYLTVAKYLRMFVNKISAFYLFKKKNVHFYKHFYKNAYFFFFKQKTRYS